MVKKVLYLLLFVFLLIQVKANEKTPIIIITDCYHPYQDPGDNLDLINGFALSGVELKAIILDISDSFRKDTADHPTLWKDSHGPREGAIIQVEQLNYIFGRKVPFAYGPLYMMKNETDKMDEISGFEDAGVKLLLNTLRESEHPVEILSFGSARPLAVAYNREPMLLSDKVSKIHLCAGTASNGYVNGADEGANLIPGGEWNVALDVCAFTRLLRSSLPIAIYPCAGKNGAFVKDANSTYWKLLSMSFLKRMHPQLQSYLDFSFGKRQSLDYLKAMDNEAVFSKGGQLHFEEFHVWETAIWLNVLKFLLVKSTDGTFSLKKKKDVLHSDKVITNSLIPCVLLEVRSDGRFQFEYTNKETNFSLFHRDDLDEYEKALNVIIPRLFISYHP